MMTERRDREFVGKERKGIGKRERRKERSRCARPYHLLTRTVTAFLYQVFLSSPYYIHIVTTVPTPGLVQGMNTPSLPIYGNKMFLFGVHQWLL